jgi:hypothetical protein
MLKKLIPALSITLASALALAQTTPANPVVRLRGTLEKVEPGSVTIRERRGETITLVMPDNMSLSEVVPISLADIKPGSFIGTAAMPRPDGTLEALEVLVFPEAARGSNEGHYPWDLQAQSTMTNATVADLAAAPEGRRMVLKYKDGEKVVVVPEKTPIVTFKPGDKALVVPGAKLLITATQRDGKPTAIRMLVGRDGFAPPM